MDLLDLLGGREVEESKEASMFACPMELMSEFLVLITEKKMPEALKMCDSILQYEPNNKMIKDYKSSLSLYIEEGLHLPEEIESEDSEDEDNEEDSDDGSESEDEPPKKNGGDESHKAEEKLAYSFHRAMDFKGEKGEKHGK